MLSITLMTSHSGLPRFQFIIAALALVAVADRPQPSYRPRPSYAAPAPTYAAPTYAPAPAYKPQPKYAPAPSYGHSSYKPIAILEQEDVHPGDGTYSSRFSTENGIYRSVHLNFYLCVVELSELIRE